MTYSSWTHRFLESDRPSTRNLAGIWVSSVLLVSGWNNDTVPDYVVTFSVVAMVTFSSHLGNHCWQPRHLGNHCWQPLHRWSKWSQHLVSSCGKWAYLSRYFCFYNCIYQVTKIVWMWSSSSQPGEKRWELRSIDRNYRTTKSNGVQFCF